MTDINLNITGKELDPNKRYIIEIKAKEVSVGSFEQISRALAKAGVKSVVIVTDTGNAIQVQELPEEVENVER